MSKHPADDEGPDPKRQATEDHNDDDDGDDEKSKRGFDVHSFGTGKKVRIPGPSADKPNIYDFGDVTYKQILEDLRSKDQRLYTENGMLSLLERNVAIKDKPERFHDTALKFDVIITCESRVFEQVIQALEEQGSSTNQPVHIVNFEIKDTPESATIGAFQIRDFCELLEAADDIDDCIEDVIKKIEARHSISLLHAVAFY